MLHKVFNALFKVVNTLTLKVLYWNKFSINITKSYFNGRIYIRKGSVHINDGFRNKKNINLSVDGGVVTIGKRVFFNNNVSINCRHLVVIGSDTIIGENVLFYDHDHAFSCPNKLIRNQGFDLGEINIGSNVWIGSNVTILKGVSVGSGSIISAGSVVTKNIPENSILIQKRESTLIKRCSYER
ncbi:acyltransferase [Pseudoalteromonas sp. SCSIO 43088]|uniref:acyltransferase n=1 Tax=Pseudoalteromonas sp. SCSIO 43088 TaxID=2822846 RepID=UPI00202B766A|nr:acyltransferase [Pseudoalteromonas sp. SCSIO 43088]URQ86603.1 acyltransferase [Pseudoalteromonas sp. SCSIO 43088]